MTGDAKAAICKPLQKAEAALPYAKLTVRKDQIGHQAYMNERQLSGIDNTGSNC
jgi:hypothetical protein